MKEGLGQGLIPSHGQIVLDPRGIHEAVVAKNQPVLFFVKGYILFGGNLLLRFWILIEEVLYHFAFAHGLGNDV